ncbi:nucleoside hydrolase [Bauldia sp.]|uniref:nucleoside hydrolase n=1 Tax=Bauldia sp. TaxID=2575872 RepID=UPI003BAC7EF8
MLDRVAELRMGIPGPMSRRRAVLVLLIFGILASTVRSAQSDAPWIIDTDMGIDDWTAILYMLENDNTLVSAITVNGSGLSRCPIAGENAARLAALAKHGEGIPVACGSVSPADGFNSYPVEWRDASDEVLGLSALLPPTSEFDAQQTAIGLLARVLEDADAPVAILSLGPMTNLARFLDAHPQLATKILKIVAMGGAVDVPGNVQVPGFTEDNPNTSAEWNFYIDPVSVQKVFESGVPVTIVPLDANESVPLTSSFIERVQATDSPSAKFLSAVYANIQGRQSIGEYYQWDPLAAVVSQNESLCEMETRRLTVVADTVDTEPKNSQQTALPLVNWRGEARQVIDPEAGGSLVSSPSAPNINVCMHVGPKDFEAEFIRAIRH